MLMTFFVAVGNMAQGGTLVCLCQPVSRKGTKWHGAKWSLHREGVKYATRVASEHGVSLGKLGSGSEMLAAHGTIRGLAVCKHFQYRGHRGPQWLCKIMLLNQSCVFSFCALLGVRNIRRAP